MTTGPVIDPSFPIGHFAAPSPITHGDRLAAIATLAEFPAQLRNAVDDLDRSQWNTPYRAGGWTVRQLVHHLADSHIAAFLCVRLALTEDWPTISPYDPDAWANLHDTAAPAEWSLRLIENVHARWVMLLQSLDDAQWLRGCRHPETGGMTIEQGTLDYAFHSRHHLAHITQLRIRESW